MNGKCTDSYRYPYPRVFVSNARKYYIAIFQQAERQQFTTTVKQLELK
jgi:hypothetical protein